MDNWTLWHLTAQTVRLAQERALSARDPNSNDVEVDSENDITKRTVRERKFEMPECRNDCFSDRVYISN